MLTTYKANYQDILIIQTAFIGDLLLSIPLLKKTRALWPQARISVLVRKGLGDFLSRSGLADHVYEVDKSNRADWVAAANALRARTWGLILSPHQSARTLLLVRSLKAEKKIGYRSILGAFIFNSALARPMVLPEALRQLALLSEFDDSLHLLFSRYVEDALGADQSRPLPAVPVASQMSLAHFTEARARFGFDQSAQSLTAKVQDLALHLALAKANRIALMAPGSVWATKRWTPEGYAEAARALITQGWTVLLIGASDERALCESIAQLAAGVQVVAGQLSLWESCELMALAHLLIANDSGAMHLASVAGLPTVAVFGPTVLSQGYRPWQTSARVVDVELPCRPCGKHGADKCPIGTHACMKQVSARDVLAAAESL